MRRERELAVLRAAVPVALAAERTDLAAVFAEPLAAAREFFAVDLLVERVPDDFDVEREPVDLVVEREPVEREPVERVPVERDVDAEELADLRRVLRRRVPPLRRSEAGTSSLMTSLVSAVICRSRRVCMRSSAPAPR